MEAIRRLVFLIVPVVSVIAFDHVWKNLAADALAGTRPQSHFFDLLRLSYHENPGAFLSLGANLPHSVRFMGFTIGVGILLALLTFYALRSRWRGRKFLGFSLFLAGGLANWTDRAIDGTVADFLIIGIGPVRTGVLNVADVSILAGVVILVCSQRIGIRKQHAGYQRAA